MEVDKATAATLFQRFGLETLPCVILTRPYNMDLALHLFGENGFTLRACGDSEDKDLPRIVGCTTADGVKWLAGLAGEIERVIAQPYDDLVFSVELLIDDAGLTAELVPGIWELESSAQPAVLRIIDGEPLGIINPIASQPARYWHNIDKRYIIQQARIEDWQISLFLEWIKEKTSYLTALRAEVKVARVGIKIHYARRYGFSPQNIHTRGIASHTELLPTPASDVAPMIIDLAEPLPPSGAVKLAAEIAREHHTQLLEFAQRLRENGTKTVYIRSGLLSHLAIVLREEGLEVRRC